MISAQDIFHWQIMDGNLTGNIREFLPIVGERVPLFAPSSSAVLLPLSSHSSSSPPSPPTHIHTHTYTHLSFRPEQEPGPCICPHLSPGHVQVAQVPGRGDPGSPGELNFPYLFQLLEDEGYKGFVGCEYQPQGEGQAEAPGLALGTGELRDRYWTGAVCLLMG